MPIQFDYNPDTGVNTVFDYDPIRDLIHLTHTQDVSKILDQIKEKRLTTDSVKGKVETFGHYAVIPAIVEMAMAKKGIKLADGNATKRIVREIEQAYPYLKTTEKRFF